jgi:FixJ family two-component response regulator
MESCRLSDGRVAVRRDQDEIAACPNRGAELGVYLERPAVDTESETAVAHMTNPDPLNLVVVDDDEEVRTALRRLLRAMGHNVRLFGSAEEYEASPVAADCLIVDLRLPGLNGFELMERLRLRGSSTPIVFITGDGGPSPNDPTIHAGTPSLAKPFDEHDLIAAITRALSATHERAR